MTKEALKLALEALEEWLPTVPVLIEKKKSAITAIKEALAQPEPVKIAHKHEWFRTGEMKVGQMRCISCGTWGQEEMPKRTWVGLTLDERIELAKDVDWPVGAYCEYAEKIEAKLKEKNELR